jgi:excisionase family DNA binding protein
MRSGKGGDMLRSKSFSDPLVSVTPRPFDETGFLGRTRAAALLDVDPQTIDKLIRRGQLRAFRLGRRVLVRKAELLQLVEANEINAS